MTASIFTPKEFLKICDKINMLPDNETVGIFYDGECSFFDKFFESRKHAKLELSTKIGLNIYEIQIYTC